MEITVDKVIDKQKVADTIHAMLDEGMRLISKEKLETTDFHKIKAFRAVNAAVNSAVAMVQQETAAIRVAVVIERMKQLGYGADQDKIQG